MALTEFDTIVPEHPYANIGNDTAKWDDGWFSDTLHARRLVVDVIEVPSFTVDILTVDNITIDGAAITSDTGAISFDDENLATTGTITGVNVTSGADPGHTHTDYLKADGSVPLTADWETGAFSIVCTDNLIMLSDTQSLYLGAGYDSKIIYNGSHLIFYSQLVGSGGVRIPAGGLGLGFSGAASSGTMLEIRDFTEVTGISPVAQYPQMRYGSAGSGNQSHGAYASLMLSQTESDYDGNMTGALYGLSCATFHYGSGSVGALFGAKFQARIMSGGGNVPNAYAFHGDVSTHASAVGSITNAYGIYLEDIDDGTTLNYAIYTNNGLTHFGDDVEITGGLDVDTTTKALIVPRMTTTQRNALAAANGMIVYDTTLNAFYFRENGSWVTK